MAVPWASIVGFGFWVLGTPMTMSYCKSLGHEDYQGTIEGHTEVLQVV